MRNYVERTYSNDIEETEWNADAWNTIKAIYDPLHNDILIETENRSLGHRAYVGLKVEDMEKLLDWFRSRVDVTRKGA